MATLPALPRLYRRSLRFGVRSAEVTSAKARSIEWGDRDGCEIRSQVVGLTAKAVLRLLALGEGTNDYGQLVNGTFAR